MKILFLTDNFPPESNAPATRTYEHCVEWVKQGAEVTVITCAPNYPKGKLFAGYRNKLYQKEEIDGIRVIRVWSYITPNRGTVKRILDYFSFCISSFIASLFIKTDLIVATSPQLFTALSGYLGSIFKRKPWVFEVRDLWPQSIKAVEAMNGQTILKILDRLVIFLYRKADHIVVVTDSFKPRIVACGADPKNISVIKNGVHMHKYSINGKDILLLRELNLVGKYIIAYIGTHGMAHKLSFILDCARQIKDDRIHFLFLGEGATKSRLIKYKESLGLTNVTFLDAVPKEEVQRYISIADVALVTLRKKDTFKTVIPSKIFENAAMKKPILLGVSGEAQEIIESYQAGLHFEPENEKDFLEKLHLIYEDQNLYERLQQGCVVLAKDFDRKQLAERMYLTLARVK